MPLHPGRPLPAPWTNAKLGAAATGLAGHAPVPKERQSHGSAAGSVPMMQWFWLFIGGGLGTLLRWWVSGWVAERVGEVFPWGTLVVNVTGSFLVGLLAGLLGPEGRWWATPETRQFLLFGFCGGYTTFSSFSLQTLNLLEEGQWALAGANVMLSVVLCLAGVWFGRQLALIAQTPKL